MAFLHPLKLGMLGMRSPLTLGIAASSILLLSQTPHFPFFSRPRLIHCESPPPLSTYSQEAKVPVVKDGRVNPSAVRQISSGSILGMIGGFAVSTFSRPLGILFGLFILGAQYLASKGYNVIPTSRIQRYVKGINLRSAIEDNVAFKMSFGATFALAAFASF